MLGHWGFISMHCEGTANRAINRNGGAAGEVRLNVSLADIVIAGCQQLACASGPVNSRDTRRAGTGAGIRAGVTGYHQAQCFSAHVFEESNVLWVRFGSIK